MGDSSPKEAQLVDGWIKARCMINGGLQFKEEQDGASSKEADLVHKLIKTCRHVSSGLQNSRDRCSRKTTVAKAIV
jgi:hypothetical protein